ncbi:MAG: ABC transporter ATP-binding protein/permease [Marinisporobacter sp.]|jgi:ATP-binding cassette subfamily B protein|nr:ABC transporter ATP-binding protein/permease [Marinisporobacter sp.]
MFHTIKRIIDICGTYKRNLISGIIFSMLYSAFGSVSLFALLYILNHVESLTSAIIRNGFFILLVAFIGQFICKWLITIKMTGNGYYVYGEKRLEIGKELKKAPMGYFSDQTLGNISSALTSSMTFMENFSMVAVENIVVGIVQAFLTTLILLYFRWEIGLITLTGLIISQLILKVISKRTASHAVDMQNAKETMVSRVIEYIRGITIVRTFGVDTGLLQEFDESLEGEKKASIATEKKVMPWVNIYKGVFDVGSGIMIMMTGYLFLDEKLTFPIAVLFLISAFVIYQHMKTMGNSAFLLPMIEKGLDRLEEVTEIPEMNGKDEELIVKDYDIEMSDVSFGYEKDRKIIHDVSLKIPQGSKTAIVGPSGCGKTTLCNLMMRFWDVDRGSIKFGGEDVKNISTDSLMSHISTVFQKVYLFHDTIENNIKFGKPHATHEEVIEAAKKACCYDFIMDLPKGFDTVVGESGSTLSGGEKQRISIARAMLKDASIVILDEATSSVDPENEHELLKALDELTRDKTVISIAHRLSTVKEANHIVVMKDGRINQMGTHNELISKEGIYKRFIDIRQKSAGWQI